MSIGKTPKLIADSESLCRTCTHVHMQKGFRESEEVIFCTFNCWDRPRLVLFKVRECTDYTDRDTPSRTEMEEMAILIEPATSAKRAGFRVSVDGNGNRQADSESTE